MIFTEQETKLTINQTEVSINPPVDDDFSSNARTDILDKYSRFHGKSDYSVWNHGPNVKFTEHFRDVVFQINPFYIACNYKNMFEACATNGLRHADEEGLTDEELEIISPTGLSYPNVTSTRTSPDRASPTGQLHEHVDTSNSCVYHPVIPTVVVHNTHSKLQGSNVNFVKHEFYGWDICPRPHSATCTGYQKQIMEDTHEFFRRQGKSACYRAISPRTFPNTLRNTRNIHGIWRNGSYGSASLSIVTQKSSRERPDDTTGSGQCSNSSSLVNISPIKVGKRFKHYKRNNSYMDQYREEYTYKKLNEQANTTAPLTVDAFICSCGNPACAGSMTSSSCIQKWYPNQSHQVKSKSTSTCEKNVTSGVPVPKRTPVLKKRPPKAPAKHTRVPAHLASKMEEGHKQGNNKIVWSKEGSRKLEFFSTSLTVNNYNPKKSTAIFTGTTQSKSSVTLSGSRDRLANQHSGGRLPVSQVPFRRDLNQNIRGTE